MKHKSRDLDKEIIDFEQKILANPLAREEYRMGDMVTDRSHECSEISAARAGDTTIEVEMRDTSLWGAVQDPNTLVGVFEIPEVMRDGAEDTQPYLGTL